MLKINETFMSFQGEGPRCGTRTLFLRLQGCNIRCPWCDSKTTWSASSVQEYEAESIFETVKTHQVNHNDNFDVCITGGEPLMQQNDKEFVRLIAYLKQDGHDITIETNGTIIPLSVVCLRTSLFSISPKLVTTVDVNEDFKQSAKEKNHNLHIIYDIIESSNRYKNEDTRIILKFVVNVKNFDTCMNEIEAIVSGVEQLTYKDIWLMPLGTSFNEIVSSSKELCELIIKHKLPYSLSNRFQVISGCK